METYEVLERALALIDTPDKWCRFMLYKQNVGGRDQYCSSGAISKAQGDVASVDFTPGHQALEEVVGTNGICTFNNTHSHGEVVEAFKTAIRREKAKAAGEPVEPVIPPSPAMPVDFLFSYSKAAVYVDGKYVGTAK